MASFSQFRLARRSFTIKGLVSSCILVALLQGHAAPSDAARQASIATYDALLKNTTSDNDPVHLGDMQVRASLIRSWRDKLAGQTAQKGGVATFSAASNGLTKWPGGIVYYAFSGISSSHQRAFLDAAREWTTFANVQFVARTTQTNYMLVENSQFAGGVSAVGMVGPAQTFRIGSWNRGTLLHEIGHTLGLIHEHQRSDRDTYVNILTANISSGAEGNFTLIPETLNNGPYDFYSIMHYARNAFSKDSATLNTIEPQAAYSSYLNIYGQQADRPLSPGDRSGMATLYGAGPALSPIVTNTKDSGPGSLRAALYYGFDHPGSTISFNIPVTDPNFTGQSYVISPSDALFAPGDNSFIDGTSQLVSPPPTGPKIVLSGSLMPQPEYFTNGLKLIGANVRVHGLRIASFPADGILITGSAATGNTVTACQIGLNDSGIAASANAFSGVAIVAGARNNTIGGSDPAARNIISGNATDGVYLGDAGTSGNIILGNTIGLRPSGAASLPNGQAGIALLNGAASNIIGGITTAARNVIAGNLQQGIAIGGTGTIANTIAGNLIGLNVAGTAAIPNGWAGVNLFGKASSNVIGGTTTTAKNIISGNGLQGVAISDPGTSGNIVSGNTIGLNPSGTVSIGNGGSGVDLFDGASGNTIGGESSTTRNIIGGNAYQGVGVSGPGTASNVIKGNFIGLGPDGSSLFPNNSGIEIFGGASGNIIGGPAIAARNIISGNNYRGIGISGIGTSNNTVANNFIGINQTGTAAAPNAGAGIAIFSGATSNLIGGFASTSRNIISGNQNQGITISDAGTKANIVQVNYIGLNAAGAAAIPNKWSGVEVFNGAQNNFIGNINFRNVISGNGNHGIVLSGTNTSGNFILNNSLGLNAASTASLGNAWSGIALFTGAKNNAIGGSNAGEGNTISGNGLRGIDVFDSVTTGNRLLRNLIYGNGQLPINLFGGSEDAYGVTANDLNDSDAGPNNLQNYPVLTSAVSRSTGVTGTTINGTLNTLASRSYRIEFFYGTPADPSQHGGCKTYLSHVNVTTNATGNANFNIHYNTILPPGTSVTATATYSAGATSEFSRNLTVTGG